VYAVGEEKASFVQPYNIMYVPKTRVYKGIGLTFDHACTLVYINTANTQVT